MYATRWTNFDLKKLVQFKLNLTLTKFSSVTLTREQVINGATLTQKPNTITEGQHQSKNLYFKTKPRKAYLPYQLLILSRAFYYYYYYFNVIPICREVTLRRGLSSRRLLIVFVF